MLWIMSSQHVPTLPLSPVQLGRLGLWLLARRQSQAASRRTAVPRPRMLTGELGRAAILLAPWRIHEYPGPYVFLAHVLGVNRETARRYCHGRTPIPAKHRERVALYLEQHIAACQALVTEIKSV